MLCEPQIPSHITALYVYASINLMVLFHVTLVSAEVLVKDYYNSTIIRYDDYPATFGPDISEDGIMGWLRYVTPHDACSPVMPPPQIDNSTIWIALIARNGCDFAVKMLHVEAAGYRAAIVHNKYGHDELIPMGGGELGNKVKIVSVFIGWHSGEELARYYQYKMKENKTDQCTVLIDKSRPFSIKNYLLPFAAMMGGCLVIGCIVMLGRSCRDAAKKRRSRLPSKHLKKIPVKKFKKGESSDVCAICLDEYEEGEKLRVLPCAHVYHCKCIDPWLTKNKRTCPVCKRRVIPKEQDSETESDTEDEEATIAPTERTPLLGRNQSNNHGATHRGRLESPEGDDAASGTSEVCVEQEGRSEHQGAIGVTVNVEKAEQQQQTNPKKAVEEELTTILNIADVQSNDHQTEQATNHVV